jgi:pimeloyl-ACP methyl ester carboxylesterase/class 3 adenylate cyclase
VAIPKVRYTGDSGCSIAYQVVGDGQPDLIFIPGLVSHLELQWTDPVFAQTLERLAARCRLIILDNRGVGLSDPVMSIPTLHERVADVSAVMEAAGSARSFLLGHCNGGPTAVLFAATFPERTQGVILCSTFAKGMPDENHPGALTAESYQRAYDVFEHWGEGRSLHLFNPSRGQGALYTKLYSAFERAALSPAMALAAIESTREIDVTSVLRAVQAPSLVLHCDEDFMCADAGRYLAANISDSKFVELRGADHSPFSGNMSSELVDEVLGFITGEIEPNRTAGIFGAVMFTDIVNSTALVGSMGDFEWRRLLLEHDTALRLEIDRHDGEYVKSTGDGVLASFTSAEQSVRCAEAAVAALGELGIATRAAVHAGSFERIGQDIAGMTIHVASRLLSQAGPGEVVVSDVVRRLVVGSDLAFDTGRSVELKGLEGPWTTYKLRRGGGSRPASWIGAGLDSRTRGDRLLVYVARRTPRAAKAIARVLETGAGRQGSRAFTSSRSAHSSTPSRTSSE